MRRSRSAFLPALILSLLSAATPAHYAAGVISSAMDTRHFYGSDSDAIFTDALGSGCGLGVALPIAARAMAMPAAGSFTSRQSVILALATPGAVLHYTTDGSSPTVNSPAYTAPLPVVASSTIKVLVTAANYTASPVLTALYNIDATGTPGAKVNMSAMTLGTGQPWNGFIPGASTDLLRQDVSSAPTSPRDAAFRSTFGRQHLDVDASIPINVVNSKTQRVTWHTVRINAGFPTPQVPLTGSEQVEPGSDHHMHVADVGTGIWYDYYHWQVLGNGLIQADSGYAYNANTSLDSQNGIGLDSTTVAGTARAPSLLHYSEAVAGTIHYATPFTLGTASRFFSSNGRCFYAVVPPATHGDRGIGCSGNPSTGMPALAYGDRFVLDPTLDLSGYAPEIRNILKAWQTYGIEYDDIGSNGVGYGLLEANPKWNVSHLAQIKAHITLANFRQVQVNGAVPILPDSNDDAKGSDTVQSAWVQTVNRDGSYTVTSKPMRNPYNRPTVTASVSPATIAVGGSVTLSATCVHGHDPYFDNAPPLINGSITVTPEKTTAYTPYCRGPYGIVKGKTQTVTVTGKQAVAATCTPGSQSSAVSLGVSCTTPTVGGVIHVQENSQQATAASPVYAGPYQITKPTTLSTIVTGPGLIQSGNSEYSYAVNIPVTHGVVQQANGYPTVTLPTAPAAGNLLLAFVSTDGQSTPSAPAGFKLISRTANDGGSSRLTVWISSTVGNGNYTFTNGVSGYAKAAVLEVAGSSVKDFVYNNASIPMVVSGGVTSRTTGPVTPNLAGRLAFAAWAGGSAGAENGTHTASSGWTVYDLPGVAYGNLTYATRNAAVSDSTTPVQITFRGATNAQFDTNGGANNTITLLLK